ncbi:MAG: hypothetical protein ACLQBK_27485 [Candidatus Sulfotelmatobacter sp.]
MRAVLTFLLLSSLAAPGQEFKPLIISSSTASGPNFTSFEFQRLAFGHEGPNYTDLEGEPSQGHRQMAIALVYNTESVGSVCFRLLDEQSKALQTLTAVRINNSSQYAEFMLAVDVPPRPFRVAMETEDLQGSRRQSVFEQLFRPKKEPPPLVRYPEGLASDVLARLQQLTSNRENETQKRLEQQRAAHPDGTVTLPHARIRQAEYAPLLSGQGNPLGVRVRYTITFSEDGYYQASPYVSPVFRNFDWRGAVDLRLLDARLEPAPPADPSGQAALGLQYGGPVPYKANVDYQFTADFIPNYVIRNDARTKFCLYEQLIGSQPRQISRWQAIEASGEPLTYSVSIFDFGFSARTGDLPPVGVFHENFIKEGAQPCGPTPKRDF